MAEFAEAVTAFFERRFGVAVGRSQLTALIGSKEGIGHLPTAVVNPGEVVLVPEPGYPVYTSAAVFAGGEPVRLSLRSDGGWLPDFAAVPEDVARRAKLMYLNYPNNPTGAVANLDFFERALRFAQANDILIAHDAAYSEVFFEHKPHSLLELGGAFDHVIEFHSLSKSFNMTGWRIAFAVGNAEAVASLTKVKDNVDSGPFNAIQHAAADALTHADHVDVRAMSDVYRQRRDIVVAGLNEAGIPVDAPEAGFYVWAPCPDGYTSMEFVAKVLTDVSVVTIPGTGFGPLGEGYFRIALTVDADRMGQAMERIRSVKR